MRASGTGRGAYHTVGECEQETTKVGPPSFVVSFEPADGQAHIGQRVIATVHARPGVPERLIDYRWFDPPSSTGGNWTPMPADRVHRARHQADQAQRPGACAGAWRRDRRDRVELHRVGYSVNAWVVEPPNPPMTWDPVRGGLQPVPRGQRATHERITLRAELQGRRA